ncbi:MAG TPA: carbohydrate kinase [Chitinophagaceae bacterium]|nr:carbohydrate kinase [Chitinophagaceae bacterium]
MIQHAGNTSPDNATVICFGEVLWDNLPGGRQIGGAPLNVAYHLHKLGVEVSLISRVGNDEAGAGIRDFVGKSGLGNSVLQTDPLYPTGSVEVMIQPGGGIIYDIIRDVAWDFIVYDQEVRDLIGQAGYLVYGSLITRNDESEKTLFALLEQPLVKILDVNLRAPYYSKDVLGRLMGKADIVKMNEEELSLIAGWFGHAGDDHQRMKGLRELFDLDILIVTCGAKGAFLIRENEVCFEPGQPTTVVDTVGSGDAFLAGFISGYIAGKPLSAGLKIAGTMGALVAGKAGGCPPYDQNDIPA